MTPTPLFLTEVGAFCFGMDMFWLYGTDGKPEAEELPGEGHLLSWDESFCFKTRCLLMQAIHPAERESGM